MPWQLVMFTCLAGLCSLPLQVINLVCRYFKFVVKCMILKWALTHQALFPLTFFLVFCIYHSCLLIVPACVLLKTLQINWGFGMRLHQNTWGRVSGMKFGLRKRWRGSDVAIVTGDSGSDAGRCTDELWHFLYTCAVVFPWKNRADDHSVIEWHHNDLSCSLGEGTI